MSVVLLGVLLTPDGLSSRPEIREDWSTRQRCWATPAETLRRVQPARVMLDIEHQGEAIGELVSLFRGESGHAWAVAVSDHDWLAEFPEPLYFSAAFRSRFDPDNLELDAVALTTESATLSKEPVEIWRGQLSSRYDRSSWHLDGVRKRVVEHAAGELRARSKRESILIRDELPPVADDYPPLRPGTYVRGAERPAGGLRHSGARGKILSLS